jgi:hypothetical protein
VVRVHLRRRVQEVDHRARVESLSWDRYGLGLHHVCRVRGSVAVLLFAAVQTDQVVLHCSRNFGFRFLHKCMGLWVHNCSVGCCSVSSGCVQASAYGRICLLTSHRNVSTSNEPCIFECGFGHTCKRRLGMAVQTGLPSCSELLLGTGVFRFLVTSVPSILLEK